MDEDADPETSPESRPPYLRMPIGYEDEDANSADESENPPTHTHGWVLGVLPLGLVFLLITAISVGVLVALSCSSDVMAETMTFARNIPEGESVQSWLRVQFLTCTTTRAQTPEFLFSGGMMGGMATLIAYVWFNPEIGFSDLI